MKNILIIGAGRSSGVMIEHLLQEAPANNWTITVGDFDLNHAVRAVGNAANGKAITFDINNSAASDMEIAASDMVISMLPPALHDLVAVSCLRHSKHLLTASYVSEAIKSMAAEVESKGLLFLCEMGLDPGIDHLSAMEIIHGIEDQGGVIKSFKSYCGGLVAKESDNNPWHYKISWNPRNVVLAGQGTARFLHGHAFKFIPYCRLFNEIENIEIEGYGALEAYPNRDSLTYKNVYGLNSVETMLRGTLRAQGFCRAWHALVMLGYTNDAFPMPFTGENTWEQVTKSMLPVTVTGDAFTGTSHFLNLDPGDDIMFALKWLGIFNKTLLPMDNASPAQLLQYLLETRLLQAALDKDLVIMRHEVVYTKDNKTLAHISNLILEGENSHKTAMAKCVGLPLAFAAELLMNGDIGVRGVHIPIQPEIYIPVLKNLAGAGIAFKSKIIEMD